MKTKDGCVARSLYKKVTDMDVLIWEELEGQRGERAWVPGHHKSIPQKQNNYSITVLFVNRVLVSGLFGEG